MSLRTGTAVDGAARPRAGRPAILLAAIAVLGVGLSVAVVSPAVQAAPVMARAAAALSRNPSSTDNELHGVSVVSGSDAWAVGYYVNNTTGATDTLILHWNGTVWTRVASPNPSTSSNQLSGVSAVSPGDAWAVGTYDNTTTGALDTLILHWNGTAWTQVASPNPDSSFNQLYGVSAVSGSEAWAAGYYDNTTGGTDTLILHWNGTAWTQVASPTVSPSFNVLYGVSAVSGGEAWAAGYFNKNTGATFTLTQHWDGTAWSTVLSPDPGSRHRELYGVSAVSGSDAWAAGYYATDKGLLARTLILHWNGTAWAKVYAPHPGPEANILYGVSAVSGSDAWAAGYYLNAFTGINDTLILHWNGTAWSKVASPHPSTSSNKLTGISADSGSDAWAVGYYVNNATGATNTLILHWNGTAWSRA